MKKAKEAAKTASAKPSTKPLNDLSNDEYTRLLARDMADTLNAKTKRAGGKRQPKSDPDE